MLSRRVVSNGPRRPTDHRAARARAHGTRARPGLAASTELRSELDELERVHVARALQSGTSYTDVARAARNLAPGGAPPLSRPRDAPRRGRRSRAEARAALIRAREEATRHGSISIDSDAPAARDLADGGALGLDVDAARRSFAPPAINASVPTGLHPALHARLTRDRGPLSLDQLLRAALEDPEGQRLLDRLGIPAQQLFDAL